MTRPARLFTLITLMIAVLMSSPPSLAQTQDVVDFCAKYSTGSTVALFFIDRTDPLLDREKKEIKRAAAETLPKVGAGVRLLVLVIEDQYRPSRTVFDNCMPGSSGLADFLFGKPQTPMFGYETSTFKAAFNLAIDREIGRPHNQQVKRSAIASTISTVTTGLVESKRSISLMTIVSDLLDNGGDPFNLPPASPLAPHQVEGLHDALRLKKLYASLGGADVDIYGFGYHDGQVRLVNGARPLLPRDIAMSLKSFWVNYFRVSGAGKVVFFQ